jgi:hypothetical protein
VLGWFAWKGALGPMLRDVLAYPSYMVAGYGKVKFPALLAWLPFTFSALQKPESLDARLGYSAPAIYAAALLLSLRVGELDLRHPLVWLRDALGSLASDPLRLGVVMTAVFGAFAFRSSMGRSDITHIMNGVAPAGVLMVVAVDRLVADWMLSRARRGVVATRAAALLIFALHAGYQDSAAPRNLILYSLSDIETLRTVGYSPPGSPQVMQIADYIIAHTDENEPVLFFPNDAAYYYLTRRPSPVRFVLGHQMVTKAHRAEVLAALRARPPRYIVWDHGVLEVDEIGYRDVFGTPLLSWIDRHYVEETRIGATRILRRVSRPVARAPAAAPPAPVVE